ncbi:MAG: hypothetical protein WEA80_01495 [Gemmatimonadaceae bacterium]
MRNAHVLATDVLVRPRHRPAAGIGDSLAGGVFAAATFLAPGLASLDGMLRSKRTARARAALSRAHAGRTTGSAELEAIWFARIAREGLRLLLVLGFADAVLRRVEVSGISRASERSCVYAIYHTPWGRVLALWMERQSSGVLLSAPRWLKRAGRAHVPCTWRGLRELVDRISHGGLAAVTTDHFGPAGAHTTPAILLGRAVHVWTGAARIAAAAGVPIVPVLTRYRAGRIQITFDAAIAVDEVGAAAATRRVIAAFDAELRRDPSGWEHAHRFLSMSPARVPTDRVAERPAAPEHTPDEAAIPARYGPFSARPCRPFTS